MTGDCFTYMWGRLQVGLHISHVGTEHEMHVHLTIQLYSAWIHSGNGKCRYSAPSVVLAGTSSVAEKI